MMRYILIIGMMLLLAACGVVATPVYDAPTATATLAPESVAEQPTVAAPTEASTEAPTEVPPTEVPTEVPTEAPTEAPTQAAAADPAQIFVQLASAPTGNQLFHEVDFETEQGVWRCATCHNTEGEEIKIGPSLFGVVGRAATRVEGQGAYTYIFNSIRDSQAYVVPGFEDAAPMPHFTNAILSDTQVYDIIAYLDTLK